MTWSNFVENMLKYFSQQVPFADGEKTLRELTLSTNHSHNSAERILKFHAEDNIYTHLLMVLKAAYEDVLKGIYEGNTGDLKIGEQEIDTSKQSHIIGMALIFSALYHDSAKWYFKQEKEVKNIGRVLSFKGHHFGGAALAREALLSDYWSNIFFGEMGMTDTEFSALYELVQIIVQNHQIGNLNKDTLDNIINVRIGTDNFDAEQISATVAAFGMYDRTGSFNIDLTLSELYTGPEPWLKPKFEESNGYYMPLPISTKLINSKREAIEDIIRDIELWGFNVILMQGIPGSGKTSASKLLQDVLLERLGIESTSVSYDDIRLELYREHIGSEHSGEETSPEEYDAAHEFVQSDNNLLSKMNTIASRRVSKARKEGKVVVLDATNANIKSRRRSLNGIGRVDKVLMVVFDIHPQRALEANESRCKIGKKGVSKDVIINQHMRFSWPFELISRRKVQVGKDEFLDRVSKLRVFVRRS